MKAKKFCCCGHSMALHQRDVHGLLGECLVRGCYCLKYVAATTATKPEVHTEEKHDGL